MMALLDIRAWLAIACAALLALVGLQQVRVSHAKAATAVARAETANLKTEYAQAAARAEADARAEESRRTEETRKVIADAQSETAAAQSAAADAARSADGLRQRVASLIAASRSTGNPSAPGRGASIKSADALDLLAGVLDRMGDDAGRIAVYADALKVAGSACERQYDSLKP